MWSWASNFAQLEEHKWMAMAMPLPYRLPTGKEKMVTMVTSPCSNNVRAGDHGPPTYTLRR